MRAVTAIVAFLIVGITVVLGNGGIFPMTEKEIANSMPLMNGIDMAVEKFNMKNGRNENEYRLVATDIVKASKQVVSGVIYYVHVSMQESVCKNVEDNKHKNVKDCPKKEGGDAQTCVFSIWSRPWMKRFGKDIIVTKINC